MTSKPIAVGDLVVVVRPGCTSKNVGRMYTVIAIGERDGSAGCIFCNKQHGSGRLIYHGGFNGLEGKQFSESRLKRIPPLDELESTKTDEPMKEPA